jgi:hypothetical protein
MSFFNFSKSETLCSLGFGSSLRESKKRDVEKCTFGPVHAIKQYSGNISIAPIIFNLGARRR